jgi:hypothetical protein
MYIIHSTEGVLYDGILHLYKYCMRLVLRMGQYSNQFEFRNCIHFEYVNHTVLAQTEGSPAVMDT